MRTFCEKDVLDSLENSGFVDIRICNEDVPEFGIIHKESRSLPIIARKKE